MKKKNTVDQDLDRTANCDKDCMCLTEGNKPHCAISDTVNGNVLFTETRYTPGCKQQHAFGSRFLCCCPMRKEIFESRKI